MINLARGFTGRGIQVDLVLAQATGPYLSQVPPHVRIVDLRARRVLASLFSLARYLRDNKPVALISAMGHVNMVALWAKWVSGVPTKIIVSIHIPSIGMPPKGRAWVPRIMPYLSRLFYPRAARIVAVSQCVADDLIQTTGLPRDKIVVIYNPVVVPELFEKATQRIAHPWFEGSERSVILSVGRLEPQKDYPTLIRAFAELRRRHDVRLMILGEGEERPVLARLISELGVEQDVALPGFVDNPYPFMAKAAVFVLSSKWEGLPTVLIEALALGAPVVSTSCDCGPAEILGKDRYGELVPVADPNALVPAIERCLTRPRNSNGGKCAITFGLDRAVEQYMNIIYPG
jgi:glycosyltransferase involved in cell wall biosynthesis